MKAIDMATTNGGLAQDTKVDVGARSGGSLAGPGLDPKGLVLRAWGDQAHLWWAQELVRNLKPRNNLYATGEPRLSWAGVDGATRYSSRSVCNTFVTLLLQQAYGWTDVDIRGWLGVRWPRAPRFVAAIEAGDGLMRVSRVDQIRQGDIMAIRYPEGSAASGHVVIVRSEPTYRTTVAPIVRGTMQLDISVVDSTRSPHGGNDTRVSPAGIRRQGAGFGFLRLYTDKLGMIVGHAWSPASGAPYRAEPEYHVAIGRLSPARLHGTGALKDAGEATAGR